LINWTEKLIELAERKIPRNPTSYTDFMGNLYFNEDKTDSIRFKIDPIRVVSLKEPDITELNQISEIVEDAFSNTAEGEYWKVQVRHFWFEAGFG
jgi:hypothetical protein